MRTLSIVVPCYNERDGIPQLLERLEETRRALGQDDELELIIVDDGSTDGTAERIETACRGRFNARVIRHERNRGLGAAMRTGFAHASGELIATTDSDCTYDPRDLVPMVRRLEQGADLVVGSAYHPQGAVYNVPAYRLFLSRYLSRLYRLVLGTDLYTYTGLMRLYRAEVIRSVPFESDDFLAVAELLVKALLSGYRAVEHPMSLSVRRHGTSKAVILQLIKDHLGFLGWLALHRARRRLAVPGRPVE